VETTDLFLEKRLRSRMISLVSYVGNFLNSPLLTSNASELSRDTQLLAEVTSDFLSLMMEIAASWLYATRSLPLKSDVEVLSSLKLYLRTVRQSSPAEDIFGPPC